MADERLNSLRPDHTTVYTQFVTHIRVRINGDDILDGRTYTADRTFVGIDWRGRDIETDPSHLQCQYNWDDQWSGTAKQNTVTIGLKNGQHQFCSASY